MESFAQRVDLLLSEAGGFLTELVLAPHSEDGESHRLIDEHLQSFWRGFYLIKQRHHDDVLSVAVLALAKSGAGRVA
jgi:hypothetical protein